MGFYREQILPRLIDKALGSRDVMRLRRGVTAGLSGEVVEIGFGSGLNVPVLPPEVTVLHAVDPAVVGRKLAAKRVAQATADVRYVGLDGTHLPLDDASCDGALCTFTLCTVPDPAAAASELYRVLRPGGAFHFVEHGLSPDEKVARWQRRLDPVQSRLFDGCHLTRDLRQIVAGAGFEYASVEQRYERGPKPLSWFTFAVAVKPAR